MSKRSKKKARTFWEKVKAKRDAAIVAHMNRPIDEKAIADSIKRCPASRPVSGGLPS